MFKDGGHTVEKLLPRSVQPLPQALPSVGRGYLVPTPHPLRRLDTRACGSRPRRLRASSPHPNEMSGSATGGDALRLGT